MKLDYILGHLVSWGEVKSNYKWGSGKQYQDEKRKELYIAMKHIKDILPPRKSEMTRPLTDFEEGWNNYYDVLCQHTLILEE